MNIIIKSLLFITLFTSACAKESKELFPSLDLKLPTPLPKAFRIPTQEFVASDKVKPTREGLDLLPISASGQFTESNLYLMLMRLENKEITIIDLREESHGYVNGLPISWKLPYTTWTNMNKSVDLIEKDETSRLKKMFERKVVVLDPKSHPFKLDVYNTYSEKELVKKYRLNYLRLPITENHAPSAATVDRIIQLIQKQRPNEWFHVHCHGGRGRTTTVMIMVDMLINSKKVSYEDIIRRHILLGGTNVEKMVEPRNPKYKAILTRHIFLKRFYRYTSTVDTSKVSWSEWIKTNHK